jgi:hypothetical protein
MEQDMILISRTQIEGILVRLHRSVGFCTRARPARFPQSIEDLHAEPTEFYSGASGYARATMGQAISILESHLN